MAVPCPWLPCAHSSIPWFMHFFISISHKIPYSKLKDISKFSLTDLNKLIGPQERFLKILIYSQLVRSRGKKSWGFWHLKRVRQLQGLRSQPVGSDTVHRNIILQLKWIRGHAASVCCGSACFLFDCLVLPVFRGGNPRLFESQKTTVLAAVKSERNLVILLCLFRVYLLQGRPLTAFPTFLCKD